MIYLDYVATTPLNQDVLNTYHNLLSRYFYNADSMYDKGIEVNTSGYAVNGNCGFPNYNQVKRYFDLGGRIITIGTDSHAVDRIGQHVEDVKDNLKKIGFKEISTFTNRIVDK